MGKVVQLDPSLIEPANPVAIHGRATDARMFVFRRPLERHVPQPRAVSVHRSIMSALSKLEFLLGKDVM
jgi:hypothetical protein